MKNTKKPDKLGRERERDQSEEKFLLVPWNG